MLGHKNLAITLGVYAKYIPRRHVKRASFLDNYDFGKSNDARLKEAT
jgi:hypothetical protein